MPPSRTLAAQAGGGSACRPRAQWTRSPSAPRTCWRATTQTAPPSRSAWAASPCAPCAIAWSRFQASDTPYRSTSGTSRCGVRTTCAADGRSGSDKLDSGMWVYLAVSGGVQTPPTLGSASTYLRGPFGGFDGRQLQACDVLRSGDSIALPLNNLAARTLPEEARPAYSDNPTLDVIMGPQDEYFTEESTATFMSQAYMVNPASDRMGYRLEGAPLTLRGKTELLSEGMTMGAIQVPSSGQPIVMMADLPTTGGYPKIGTVASADLPLLAQCAPGRSKSAFGGRRLRRRRRSIGR
ncbi:MAG: hypothetical protein MZV64_60425 [Ignavibacteriales bacterium]|nr:hypothetical protein [Ignavibacteriales bacterium]